MITFNGDSLFNKHFILKGILTIRDIIDEYGTVKLARRTAEVLAE